MLMEHELARKMPTKATNTWKCNYQNKDKKENGTTSKEVHALDRNTKSTPNGTTHTQALECLL